MKKNLIMLANNIQMFEYWNSQIAYKLLANNIHCQYRHFRQQAGNSISPRDNTSNTASVLITLVRKQK